MSYVFLKDREIEFTPLPLHAFLPTRMIYVPSSATKVDMFQLYVCM